MQRTEKSSSTTPASPTPATGPAGGPRSRPSRGPSGRSSSGNSDFAFSPDRTYSEDVKYLTGMVGLLLERGHRLLAEAYMRAGMDVWDEAREHVVTCKGCKKCQPPVYKARPRRRRAA